MTVLELTLSLAVVALAVRCWCYRTRVADLEERGRRLAEVFHRGIERQRAMADGLDVLRRHLGLHRRGGPDDA